MAALTGQWRLVIDAWAGSVNVSAGRGESVEVALRGWGVLPAPALEIERDGDDVYVEARSAPQLSVAAALGVAPGADRGLRARALFGGRGDQRRRVEIHGFDGDVAVRNL
jgi:hypothetical protein